MPIDNTFEVQVRSVLSEGWHEVEHDLRYKKKSYWNGRDDLSRALNGIVATLETSEWAMKKIFDDLAYQHYKNKNWGAMLLLKLRIRLDDKIETNLIELLNNDHELSKKIYRMDRSKIIEEFSKRKPQPPLTANNAIFIWNLIAVNNEKITALTPSLLIEQ